MQETLCTQFETEAEPETDGPALFPGRDFTRNYGVPISKTDVDKTGNIFNPSVIGAVCYMLGPKVSVRSGPSGRV